MGTQLEHRTFAKKADAGSWLHEAAGLSVLYEYYGALLPERQRLMFEDYIANDMSLAEIAGEYGMSRQGVLDAVRRSSAKLYEYEEKLRLAERFRGMEEQTMRIRSEAEEIASATTDPTTARYGRRLAALAQELWERLQ